MADGTANEVVRWQRGDGLTAVPADVVEHLARCWEDGWNREDVDLIVAPFAPGIVFSSPFVSRLSDDGATELRGLSAVRDYVAASFHRATPGIRYTHDDSYAGVGGVVLLYTVHHPDGTARRGADLMDVDGEGRVVAWRCHYPFG